MLDHTDVLLALRARLLGTQIATTGSTSLAATGNGFTRTSGSFLTDGFLPGLEVVPSGFASNTAGIIASVSALAITLTAPRAAQAAGIGRSLTVGIPQYRVWENVGPTDENGTPTGIPDGIWYIAEDYIPGPSRYLSASIEGVLEHHPMYVIRIAGPSGKGVTAHYALARGILLRFLPRLSIQLSDGNFVRVKTEPTPEPGQLTTIEAGRAGMSITIPLWAHTFNPL